MSCVTGCFLLAACGFLPLANAARNPSPLISADWPPPQHPHITRPTSRCERFRHVQVAAKADEVRRTLQISLPAAEAGVVAQVVICRQPFRESLIVAVINPRMRDDRGVLRARSGTVLRRRRRDEAP